MDEIFSDNGQGWPWWQGDRCECICGKLSGWQSGGRGVRKGTPAYMRQGWRCGMQLCQAAGVTACGRSRIPVGCLLT